MGTPIMTSITSNSPISLLQAQLSSGVSSGKIKAADQNALSSALSDIDSSLQSSGLNGAAPSKSTIEDLISKEVSSGKLTTDQGNELQQVFGSFAANGSSASSTSSGSSSSSNSSDLIGEFMKELKNSSVTGYGSSGVASSSLTSVLLDLKT